MKVPTDSLLAGFVADEEMRATLDAATETTWPDALIEIGGVAEAAGYLSDAAPPPDVLVIDLGDSEQPYEDLMGLSEVCHPDTQVVAIGTVNDLAVYRRIVSAGVVDYLVRPVVQEDLETALTTASQRRPEVLSPSGEAPKTVVVIGARGGVGASTIASNGAWLMAETLGRSTVLLDLDVQFGTSALSMDVLPSGGLIEALQHPDRVDTLFMASAITPKTKRLAILAAEEDIGRDASFAPSGFERMLSELGGSYEWIWIDLPRTMVSNVGDGLSAMNTIVLVSDLSLAGMRDTLRLKNFCRSRAPHVEVSIILNRTGAGRGDGITVSQFERGVESSVAFELQEDAKNAAAAATAGKPLAELLHKKKQMADFKLFINKIAGNEDEETEKKKGFLGGKKRTG